MLYLLAGKHGLQINKDENNGDEASQKLGVDNNAKDDTKTAAAATKKRAGSTKFVKSTVVEVKYKSAGKERTDKKHPAVSRSATAPDDAKHGCHHHRMRHAQSQNQDQIKHDPNPVNQQSPSSSRDSSFSESPTHKSKSSKYSASKSECIDIHTPKVSIEMASKDDQFVVGSRSRNVKENCGK